MPTNINDQADYQLQLHFDAPAERVFEALTTPTGIQGWWTKFCEMGEGIGVPSSFHFPAAGFFATVRALRLEAPTLVEWECLDSRHDESTGYHDLKDWVGTRMLFEIRDTGDGNSELQFTHFGLAELECIESCSRGWSFFLDESLRGYLERGQGQPWDQA